MSDELDRLRRDYETAPPGRRAAALEAWSAAIARVTSEAIDARRAWLAECIQKELADIRREICEKTAECSERVRLKPEAPAEQPAPDAQVKP